MPGDSHGWTSSELAMFRELRQELQAIRQAMIEVVAQIEASNERANLRDEHQRERLTTLEASTKERFRTLEQDLKDFKTKLEEVQRKVWALPKAATVIAALAVCLNLVVWLVQL